MPIALPFVNLPNTAEIGHFAAKITMKKSEPLWAFCGKNHRQLAPFNLLTAGQR
ncbi:MAG: hypothetical protein RJAPGHWK_001464 [Candidatus Fervidibacter sp.]